MSCRGLICRGVVIVVMLLAAGVTRADEVNLPVLTAIGSTTLSGYVDTSILIGPVAEGPGVAAIPEPSTMALLAVGIVGGWLARGFRSRTRKAQR